MQSNAAGFESPSYSFQGREARLLAKIQPQLARLLRAGEWPRALIPSGPPLAPLLVHLVTSPRRAVLVLTNRRMLCVFTKRDFTPLESVFEVAWGDIARTRVSVLTRTLFVEYASGRKESFSIERYGDARRLPNLLRGAGGEATPDLERRFICPDCGNRVAERPIRCARCGLPFRSMRNAVRFALWWPGGGYFFLGRISTGVLAVAVELLLLFVARSIFRFHELGRLADPWQPTLMVAALWIAWKIGTALHVAHAAREPIADRAAAARPRQLPPALAAGMLRGVADGIASHGATIGSAARNTVAALELTSASLRGSIKPVGERAGEEGDPGDVESWAGVPCSWRELASQLSDEEREAVSSEQRRLLATVAPALRAVLEPGEAVVYVTPGATPFSLVDYLGPAVFLYFIRRCVFVFTDRRMLMARPQAAETPLPNISVVRYADVAGYAFAGGYGLTVNFKIRLAYASGRVETFNRIPLEHFLRLQTLLPRFVAHAPAPSRAPAHVSSLARQRIPLCLWCGDSLRRDATGCGLCGARYRSRSVAGWLAALLPGGGFFYVGRPKLGVLDAVVEVLILANLLGVIIALAAERSGRYVTAFFVYLLLLTIEKAVSVHHARELAGEFVVRSPPTRPEAAVSEVPSVEVRWVLTTFVAAFGVLLIVAAVGARLPLYAKQWDLSHARARLQALPESPARRELVDLCHELVGEPLDYCVEEGISWAPVAATSLDEERNLQLVARYRIAMAEYRKEKAQRSALERRAATLEAEIGDAWVSAAPGDVFADLLSRTASAAP